MNLHLSHWTILSLLILHLAAKVATLASALLWPSSFSIYQNCSFPLCLLLQIPKREAFTFSAFLLKSKYMRHRSLDIVCPISCGHGQVGY